MLLSPGFGSRSASVPEDEKHISWGGRVAVTGSDFHPLAGCRATPCFIDATRIFAALQRDLRGIAFNRLRPRAS
jgi:hypothetical protein